MSKEPKRNVYVGHRYVPKIMGEWDKQETYEGLSIVTHQGNSYTSKKRVPVGIDISDEEYWVVTGNYNAQIEQYRQDVRNMQEQVNSKADIDFVNNEINNLNNEINNVSQQLDQTSKRIGVTYEQFGAKLDGVTDDTEAIRAAHNYANEHGYPVVQRNSVFVLNGEVEVKTDLDLSGSTVITKWNDDVDIEYDRVNILYRITGKEQINVTGQVNQSEFKKGVYEIPSLQNLPTGSLTIKTSQIDMIRNDGGIMRTVYMHEPNAKYHNDGKLFYPLTKDFSSASGFTVLIRPFEEERLTIKLPKLVCDNAKIRTFIQVERNNVDIFGGSLEEINASAIFGSIYNMINVYESHDVTINSLNCSKIGRDRTEQFGRGYTITMNRSSMIHIDKMKQRDGWGAIDGNYYRDLRVTNSTTLNVSGHFSCYDITVKDSTIRGGMNIHGGGVLDVDNVVFEGVRTNNLIQTRVDYAGEFEGLIRVRNVVCYNVVRLVTISGVEYNCGRKVHLPNIDIENVTIKTRNMTNVRVFEWRGFADNYEVELPQFIRINNVTSNINRYNHTISFPNDIVNENAEGEIRIDISNVLIPFGQISSTSDPQIQNIQLPIVSENIKIVLNIFNSLATFAIRCTSNIKVNVENSDVVAIRNNNGSQLRTEYGDPIEFNFRDCDVYRMFNDFIEVGRVLISFVDCRYRPWIRPNGFVDNEVAPNINPMVVYSKNNVAESTMDISNTSFRMFNWIDPNYWVTVEHSEE